MAVSRTDFSESVAVASAKTLAEGDCGVVQNVTASATLTLPATVAGMTYTIRNGGNGSTDGAVTVTIAPAALDKIMGNGFTSADAKTIINTLGRGGLDEVTLVGDGVNGWFIQNVSGTWTRQA